jgi:NAD-dependent DNA ligase
VDVLQLPKKPEVEENKRVRVRGEIYRQQYAHLDLNSSANLTGLSGMRLNCDARNAAELWN